ncbi:glycoside hydrolase family 2 protein [Flavobacterium sp.]|uniref:glycoside hydrolase family 2 protein n=1 Tax=Flavobacterium sp. TaxID=239 RepID=UPI003D101276
MLKPKQLLPFLVYLFFLLNPWFCESQTALQNVASRNTVSLNGKWQAIIDPTNVGDWRQIWQEKKPEKKTDFIEYSFDGSPLLNVPGDFNTQMPEITYLEGVVWYKKAFTYNKTADKRYFIHFGAVNYVATVYLNGKLLGSHEGGFTPFQFEITDLAVNGTNSLIVKVNNQRLKDGLPGLGYDWFNYGGITRDVNLVATPASYIDDYFIQLKKASSKEVLGWVQLKGTNVSQKIKIKIPELGVSYATTTDNNGKALVQFSSKFQLWSPENPKLYKVTIESETDAVTDEIGFRTLATKGTEILLNGKTIFLKGTNIHEENPLTAAKAFSDSDALILLTWAKELGCNFVRLAHYPHNENMVKMAEKMGLLVWDELPVYQHIEFATPGVTDKMETMLKEMIGRDKNRCGVFIWSISNETYSTTPNRNEALIALSEKCREIDDTRLVTSVINNQGYSNNTFDVNDPLYNYFDVIALNEYIGWYAPWQGKPQDTKWKFVANKPVIISEFGGEALYGSHYGPTDEAAYWTEEYQEQIYKDQIAMFKTTPNLAGVCPWILVDYRSLGRMHPVYQNGWNRKGLLSDRGDKKKAWYILQDYYKSIPAKSNKI